jgi:hypothetical protein
VPVAIELSVDLLLVLAFLVAVGFLLVYRGTMKPLLLGLADLFDKVSIPTGFHDIHIFGPISSFLRYVAATIDYGLSQAAEASKKGVILLWHALAQQVKWLGGLLGDLADTIESQFKWLLLVFPPAALIWATIRAAQQIPHLWQYAKSAAATIENGLGSLGGELDKLRRAIEAQIARDLARAKAAAGSLGRDLSGALARLKRIEKAVTKAGAVALVGAALAALGAGWIRCPRVGKVGKSLCGVNADLLESLIADTLIIAGTVSLVEFAKGMQTITKEIEGPIRKFWRAA